MADETPPRVVVTERKGQAAPVTADIVVLKWWQQALIRCSRVYLQSLVGLLTASGTGLAAKVGVDLPVQDFWHLLLAAASMAVAPAVISLIQNSVEMLTKLDSSKPTLRA